MEAQSVPSPTNALIVSMIIALGVLASAVLIGEAQGVMVVICQRICRENVLGFGHHRCSRRLSRTAFTSTLASWSAATSTTSTTARCVVFVPDLKYFVIQIAWVFGIE